MKFIATTGILLALSAPAFAQLPPSNCQHYQVGGRTYTKCSTDPVPDAPAPQQAPAPAPVPVPPPPPQAQLQPGDEMCEATRYRNWSCLVNTNPRVTFQMQSDCERYLSQTGQGGPNTLQICAGQDAARFAAEMHRIDQERLARVQNLPPPSPRDLCLSYAQAFKPSVVQLYGGNERWNQAASAYCSQLPGW